MNKMMNSISPLTFTLLDTQQKWYAIYTKYRCEKYVVENLNKKGIEAYLPLKSITKRYTRKIKKYQIPLINCYAFVKINEKDIVKVLQSEYVIKFIKTGQELEPIRDEEMDLLKRVTGEFNDIISVEPINWQEGSKVEIVVGGMVGTKGMLVRKKGKNTFIIALDSMGVQLEMEVDKSYLGLSN
jgi:transcription antitermination factor NusG